MDKQPLPQTLTSAPPTYIEANTYQANAPQMNLASCPPNQSNQPIVVVISNDQVAQKCPQCGQLGSMEYQDVLSTRQHLWALCLCLTW